MYNEILVFPCMGFDRYTKQALKAQKEHEQLMEKEE